MSMPLCQSCRKAEEELSDLGRVETSSAKFVSRVVQTTPHLTKKVIGFPSDKSVEESTGLKKKRRGTLKGVLSAVVWSLHNALFPTNGSSKYDDRGTKPAIENFGKTRSASRSTSGHHKAGYNKLSSNNNLSDHSAKSGNRVDEAEEDDDDESENYEGSCKESSSDESDWDREDNSCIVCERAFFTVRQLERHQLKKRHYGCGECDQRFHTLMLLEYHKEEYDHWTDDELRSENDFYVGKSGELGFDNGGPHDYSAEELEKEFLLL